MYKGIGFWPVITALKAHPHGAPEVPAKLKHYLDDDVVVSGWYPEADFIRLTACLARVLEMDGKKDVWKYFGQVAAQRDLKGGQALIPEERRVATAGLYRRFAADEVVTVGTWLSRATKLWTLYHDTGVMIAGRSAAVSGSAAFRLLDFPMLDDDYACLLTAYYQEYARIMDLRATISLGRLARDIRGFTEWNVHYDSSPEAEASLEFFPLLD